MDLSVFDNGLGFAISALFIAFVIPFMYKLSNIWLDSYRQNNKNAKRIAEKNEKHIDNLIQENKKNTEEFKKELAKSNSINIELSESNRKHIETLDMAVRTIEFISNTHANMLANVNSEVIELRDTQTKNHAELLDLINSKGGENNAVQ